MTFPLTLLQRLCPGPECVYPVMPPAHQPCGGLGGGRGKLCGRQRVGGQSRHSDLRSKTRGFRRPDWRPLPASMDALIPGGGCPAWARLQLQG